MSRIIVLEQFLNKIFPEANYQYQALNGDASFRRYFRVQRGQDRFILMDAPYPESPEPFVGIATRLQKQGLKVPEIFYSDLSQGFLLLSDFGDRLYLQALKDFNNDYNLKSNNFDESSSKVLYTEAKKSEKFTPEVLYQAALQSLDQLQSTDSKDLPIYDSHFLSKQSQVFFEWYLQKHLKFQAQGNTLKTLTFIYEHIHQVVLEIPKVFVHMDYHSRNLMVLEQTASITPGILDFQDAMLGPVTYDLVSLLQDCYISWPRSFVEKLSLDFLKQKQNNSILSKNLSPQEFLKWLDYTGLQRHLKNLGVFARLKYRDGKNHYIKDMIKPLTYSLETCDRYSELKPLGQFLRSIQDLHQKMSEVL